MSRPMRVVKEVESESNEFIAQDYSEAQQSDSYKLLMSQMNIATPNDFNKEFATLWQTSASEQVLLSIIQCEIDSYNEYVDNYGVQATSFMLISLALTLKQICDKNGCFLSRNEQQGFTILTKGGAVHEAQSIADQICEAVKATKTEHKFSTVSDYITLSVGVSSFHPVTKPIFSAQATQALEKAKENGGNRVNSYQQQTPPALTKVYANTETHITTIKEKSDKLQHKSEQEEQNTEAKPSDYFANEESLSNTQKTYRGNSISEDEQESALKHALKENEDALNKSKVEKEPKFRYYRGQKIYE